MNRLFYIGLIGLAVFEILSVYLIMPMPGSQRMNSIDVAYFLHAYRWWFRVIFFMLIIYGTPRVLRTGHKWIPATSVMIVAAIIYFVNFEMTADRMFIQPQSRVFKSIEESDVPLSRIVLGVEHNGEAKAYPIQFIAYHHQVRDTIGGKPIMVTYCNVCRSGRVFEPKVNGKYENFRLVGMDHFNAMFEDESSKSWWRQATGEAVAGPRKGAQLPEVMFQQMTLETWSTLHPNTLVMQMDSFATAQYDSLARFERGKSESSLTYTDSLSWKEKSWIVGVHVNDVSKVYDWQYFKSKGVINDLVDSIPIVIALASDGQSFAAFKRPTMDTFAIDNDTLLANGVGYDFTGRDYKRTAPSLAKIYSYQEFWHSWQFFRPESQVVK